MLKRYEQEEDRDIRRMETSRYGENSTAWWSSASKQTTWDVEDPLHPTFNVKMAPDDDDNSLLTMSFKYIPVCSASSCGRMVKEGSGAFSMTSSITMEVLTVTRELLWLEAQNYTDAFILSDSVSMIRKLKAMD
uniref:Uncharacterized protein n=1 Tax=Arion vulgaris TaxID=1028688 RepID=A0A0B7ABU5_9EUPU